MAELALVAFALLVASTALAIDQNGVGSAGLWIGWGLAVLASVALAALRRLAQGTGPALESALEEGLGADWRDGLDPDVADRLRRRPSLARVLLAPVSARRRGVERVANVRYGPAGRANLLDVYRDRSHRSDRPVLVHFHPLFGSKRLGTRYLFHRLAGKGWVCVAANYRRGSGDGHSESLIDAETVIAWVREHCLEYGVDSSAVFVAGSSLGGHLASLAAFEGTSTSVAGVISLYGYYGRQAPGQPPPSCLARSTVNAPPCFVAHGTADTLIPAEDARRYVARLRATSPNPVVYAELPGAQHGFDLIRSRRLETVVTAIEAFAASARRL